MLQHASRSRSGFTMIELLVVIAILVGLAAVSYPMYMSFRESGHLTKCRSNVTQLLALGQKYGDDFMHRDMRPVSGMEDDEDTFVNESKGWWVSVAPLVLKENEMPQKRGERLMLPGIFHCPKDLRANVDDSRDFNATPKTVSYVSWTDNSKDASVQTSAIQLRKQNYDTLPWLSDGIPVAGKSVQTVADFKKMVLPAASRHDGQIVVGYVSGGIKVYDMNAYSSAEDAFKRIAPDFAVTKKKKKPSK